MKLLNSHRIRPLAGVLGALLVSAPALAQWSSDPAASLIVSDIAGGNTQPKIVPAPDGGFYVSWFSDTGGFDIYLQRLDAGGHALWAHNGILVADRDYGFTYDYGLAVDANGNAFVAFNCCASDADEHIAISKVNPDGTLAWGAAGISVSTAGSEGVYNAYVTAASDGNVVVAWSADNGVRAQRLDQDGNTSWTDGGIELTQPAAALKLLGDVEPAENGNVIVSWSNQAGSARILTAQKLAAADGSVLWGDNAVRVFGQGNLQAGYYPPFIADGAGGGVFYDYDYAAGLFVPRVQHLDAGGNRLLGANGVVATTDTTQNHVNASASFDAASGDIYVVWDDNYTSDDFQTYDGVSAQRIDATGSLAWGDTGKVLVTPANSTDGTAAISQLIALPAPGGFLASWVTGAIPAADQPLTVAGLAASGDYLWTQQTVAVKTSGYTGRAVGTVGVDGFAVYAWQDGDDGAGASRIAVQNVNFDGTLGNEVSDTIFA
ncbi:MAG TPA: hypothetical protein VGC55_10785, partial [Dokdonella sp.]